MARKTASRIVRLPSAKPVKAKKKRRRFSFALLAVCIVMIYFGHTFYHQARQLRDLLAQEAELNARFTSLKNEIENLQREVELLGTDEYIERLARERLGLVRPQDIILKPIYSD